MNLIFRENDNKANITFYNGISLEQIKDIDKRWNEIFSIIHKEVFKYINDDNLCFDENENSELFPIRKKLTGNYYIDAISYSKQVSPIGIQIMITTRFTEHCLTGEDDYLGLDVTLFTKSKNDIFEVWGIDSYSI
ncbi:hypothetical protein COL68_29405 [Bacillus wiedmannii]|uniref:DUF2004 domain-containing protein n=1 Tax=Bacillus wiedmannii TaxID=1890302 RepID=A0A2B5NVM3_9BACI|nr:hypothetical protein [Bacillus wiedmannii]PEM49868.1 hypothetical protein CN618_17140 [Bacillus wiedmannii]PEP53899.1 hypothetical protein CN557_08635 [Bacillus wiedmannii]PFZ31273.1 hypothetical protein COL66_12660 [Bacillus wiedmannii]PFZ50230.1 hypothetical protein COL68_29405 [Bacillus wiedmannii]PFZ90033.1 hypothetical protein COL78_27520 [Bacillus wiedmannii]